MMSELENSNNKNVASYRCVLSEYINETGRVPETRKYLNKKHKDRKRLVKQNKAAKTKKNNEKFIKILSNCHLSTDQTNILSRGLRFILSPQTKADCVRKQLLSDFDQFARRMRLRYIYYDEEKQKHPFYVKSDWITPVQPSVALETYLEEVKLQLAEIEITKPKNNLPQPEHKAIIKELREKSEINIKKADKGTTTVIMNKEAKIKEGLTQLNVEENYKPLEAPMVGETLTEPNN